MLTNSASSIGVLGTLNASAVSLSALARTVGPPVAGAVFSWGWDRGWVGWAWWLLAGIAVCGHGSTWLVKEMGAFGEEEEGLVEEELGLLDAEDGEGFVGQRASVDGDAVHETFNDGVDGDCEKPSNHEDVQTSSEHRSTDQMRSRSSTLATGAEAVGMPPRLRSPMLKR